MHNARFASTNSLYSLWLARDLVAGGFVVLNGDVLFHPQLLWDLLTARYDDALLMAAREADATFSDEEMKVRSRFGCVVVLKGTGTLVAAPGKGVLVGGGHPSLATAGTGDVLTGIVGAFLAKGMEPRLAAAAAVTAHTWAAIEAPFDVGLVASDLLDSLPQALR